jgi:probable HAF family extracellular repeat protein
MLTRSFAWLIALLAWPHLAAQAAPIYAVTPVTGKFTSAVALNDAGQVAVNNHDSNVPFRTGFIIGGGMVESVGTLGGSESAIHGMNNKGEAVGDSQTASGLNHAFLYSGGRIQDLTVVFGIGSAADINDRGDIAGQAGDHGALVRAGGTVGVFGPAGTHAVAINNSGDVVGDYVLEGKGIHAFLYAENKFSDLGTLGGTFSTANSVNDAGTVVGNSSIAVGQDRAFVYSDGVMTELGSPTSASSANGINDLGQIVGTIDNRAFLYANGIMTDLNTLIEPEAGVLLVSALAINNRQQILANACDPSGTFCDSAVRLDPIPLIPEPSSIAMLLAGAVLLGVHRLRGVYTARLGALRP